MVTQHSSADSLLRSKYAMYSHILFAFNDYSRRMRFALLLCALFPYSFQLKSIFNGLEVAAARQQQQSHSKQSRPNKNNERKNVVPWGFFCVSLIHTMDGHILQAFAVKSQNSYVNPQSKWIAHFISLSIHTIWLWICLLYERLCERWTYTFMGCHYSYSIPMECELLEFMHFCIE